MKSAFSELHISDKKNDNPFVELNLVGQVGIQEKLRITLLCMEDAIQKDRHLLENEGERVRRMRTEQSSEGDDLDEEVARIFAQQNKGNVFKKYRNSASQEDEDEQDLQAAVQKGILTDEEDDLALLDGIPTNFQPSGFSNNSKSSRRQSQETRDFQQNTNRANRLGQSVYRMFLDHFLKEVAITGFNTNAIPAITNLTYFMNQAFLLRKHKRKIDELEINFMVGVLLISTKRSMQTAEFFRRVQNQLLARADKAVQLGNDSTSLFMQCAVIELLIAESMCIETQINEKMHALNRMIRFTECSTALVSLSSNNDDMPSRLNFAPQIIVQDDAFSIMLRILPKLLSFLVICLSHRREIVQISALKILKFVLETQGCSLDHGMVFVLKGMLQTFPKLRQQQQGRESRQSFQNEDKAAEDLFPGIKSPQNENQSKEETQKDKEKAQEQKSVQLLTHRNSFDLTQLFDKSDESVSEVLKRKFQGVQNTDTEYTISMKSIKEPTSGFQTALTSVYQHVLDTYISVLSSISSHILHGIFYEVIEPILLRIKIKNEDKEKDKEDNQDDLPPQVIVFTVKIAEKIITICQGDLLLSHPLLEMLVTNYTANNKSTELAEVQKIQALKNLWQSVRQKVFPNYSNRGSRLLLNWILQKFQALADYVPAKPKETKTFASSQGPKQRQRPTYAPPTLSELPESDTGYLSQLCDLVAIISMSKQKLAEEEQGQLIKLPVEKIGKCGTAAAELYLCLPPLLFWMEYSIDREERLALFQQIYNTIKDVLVIMPRPGSKRKSVESKEENPNFLVDLNLVQVMMPTLERTSEFLQGNSPSLSMLKFLEMVLQDIISYFKIGKTTSNQNNTSPKQPSQFQLCVPEELKVFFSTLLSSFVQHISYSLYEEVFPIFDKLMALTGELIDEAILRKCIVSLVDKYTIKSKHHKVSLTQFMKTLMDIQLKVAGSPTGMMDTFEKARGRMEFDADLSGASYGQQSRTTYFEVMTDFCYFQNSDVKSPRSKNQTPLHNQTMSSNTQEKGMAQLDFRGPADMHDLFVDKIQFFIDSLSLLNETHINLFTNLITHPNFKPVLLSLIEHGETQIRLKSHEVLEVLTAYFVHYCPSKTVYEFEDGNNSKSKSGALSTSPVTSGDNIMDAEFISHERMYISQIVIKVARKSLEQADDCYLQFNALISLDFLFQKLLPVPSFANEQVKRSRNNLNGGTSTQAAGQDDPMDLELTLDIEALSLNEQNLQQFSGQMSPISPTKHECLFSAPELDVLDPRYLRMRMKLVLSLWPHIQQALNSPWSNIRSVCYGLICSIFKIDVRDYPQQNDKQQAFPEPPNIDLSGTTSLGLSDILSQNLCGPQILATAMKLKQIILPMLYGLLSSKESESKAGGLNILGSFCGLSYDFSQVNIQKYRPFFQRNSAFVSLPIWRLVYDLQDDWDITIKEASVVLVQLCAPRNAICFFEHQRQLREQEKVSYMFTKLPRVSLCYADSEESIEDEEVVREKPNHLVSSRQAKKAYALFPDEKARQVILESIKEEDEEQEVDRVKECEKQKKAYEAFLIGKRKPLPSMFDGIQHAVGLGQIDQENSGIETQLVDYEPVYQKALQASKPMTRKRQLEIELDIRGRRGEERKDEDEPQLPVNFFVDRYSDDQIQEIISIFRNDFQPPKNLWIEKQANSGLVQGSSRTGLNAQGQGSNPSGSPDFYADIYAEAIEAFNAQQTKLQMEQQEQLQKQVSSGGSQASTSQNGSQLSQLSSSSEPEPQSDTGSQQPTEPAKPETKEQKEPEKVKPAQQTQTDAIDLKDITPILPPEQEKERVTEAPKPQQDLERAKDKDKDRPLQKSSKEKQLNIDNLDFDNIALTQQKKRPSNKPEEPPKPTKKHEERIRTYFSPESGQMGGSHAASSDYLRFRPTDDHLTNQFGEQKEDDEAVVITNKRRGARRESREKKLGLADNQFFATEDKAFQNLKPNTTKALKPAEAGFVKSGSDPGKEFGPRQFKPTTRKSKAPHSNGSGGAPKGIEASGGSNGGSENFISRKTAQTFLAGLSKGYISKIDNVKLVKSCLSGNPAKRVKKNNLVGGSQEFEGKISPAKEPDEPKKKINKSFENLNRPRPPQMLLTAADSLLNSQSAFHTSKSIKGKKTTLSTSPKRSQNTASTTHVHSRKPSSTRATKKGIIKRAFQGALTTTAAANSDSKRDKSHKMSSTTKVGNLLQASNQAVNMPLQSGSNSNLCDLNFFIKTIERDLTDKFQKMQDLNQSTPKSLLKNVEEQMRALGIDIVHSKKIAASVASGALRNASPTDVQSLIKKLESDVTKEQTNKTLLPKLRLIALNQKIATKHEQQTASGTNLSQSNGSHGSQLAQNVNSDRKEGSTGAASSFNKGHATTALSFRQNLQPKSIKTHRDRSEGSQKRSAHGSSDSKGRNRSSGAYSMQFPMPPQMMTERSHRVKGELKVPKQPIPKTGKSSATEKFDSAKQVKFQPPNVLKAKSQTKQYNSTKNSKVLSPVTVEPKLKKNLIPTSDAFSLTAKQRAGSKPKSSQAKKEKPKGKLSSQAVISANSKKYQTKPTNGSVPLLNTDPPPDLNLGSTLHPAAYTTTSTKTDPPIKTSRTNRNSDFQNYELSLQNIPSTKYATSARYSKPEEEKAKVIEYYSPIQITGRFMDNKDFVPPNAYNNEPSDQEQEQADNNSAPNQNKKQKSAFTGRDPRKPPMLQPTSYY